MLSSHQTPPQTFKHEPVQGTTIRIFEFDQESSSPPSSRSSEWPISGRLLCFTLAEAPPFLALSYAWGRGPRDIPLQCNGQTQMITRSLANALQNLRSLCGAASGAHPGSEHNPEFATRYVWVDQICIDQGCPGDRSHQVTLMGQIYSKAIRTVAWLGGDGDDGLSAQQRQSAWTLVDQIYGVFQEETSNASSISDISPDTYQDKKHASYGLPPLEDAAWDALSRTISLPWFSRIWIIQEVVLSPLDPILMHGDLQPAFSRLGWVASWLRRKGYLRCRQLPRQFQNIDTIVNIRRSQSPWPLEVLLTSTSAKFYASDQRDKIYGLLGMAAETQDPANWPAALETDYALDLAQVYTKIALFLFEQRQSIVSSTRCISAEACSRRFEAHGVVSSRMPTWVPQWSDPADGEEIKLGNLVWITYPPGGGTPSLGFSEQYKAAKRLPLSSWACNGGKLSVEALHVDTVQLVLPLSLERELPMAIFEKSPSFSSGGTMHPADRQTDIYRIWNAVRRTPRNTLREQDLFKMLVRALTADKSSLGGIDEDQMYRDGAAFYLREKSLYEPEAPSTETRTSGADRRWLKTLRSWMPTCWSALGALRDKARGSSREPWMLELAQGGDPETFAAISRVYSMQRAFLVTESGRLGLCPKETRPGDSVYVIPGGDVPYIVSWEDDAYVPEDRGQKRGRVLLGESWVGGLMAGEAVDAWRGKKLQMETLELC